MDTATTMKWLSIAMAIIAAVSAGAIHLPVGTPDWLVADIKDWSLTILQAFAVIKPFLPADIVGPGASIPTNTPQKPAGA